MTLTCARLTCVVLDFPVRSSTRLICGMRDRAVLFWPEPHCEVPICAAHIYVRLSKLDGADLSDANLEGAEGITRAQLDRAHLNVGTKLREGCFQRASVSAWERLVWSRDSSERPGH